MPLIRLLSVTGIGFLSFYDQFDFNVSRYEGKALQIDGQNESDDMAWSNGAGKSSLIEAVPWGWYGELCRKNKYKDEVIYNRNGVKAIWAYVVTKFKANNQEYRTERRLEWGKPQALYLYENGEAILKDATPSVKQEHLEKILGMNFIAFQSSVIFGGPTSSFLCFPDLKPSERGKVLTDLRGLDKYVKASEKCSKMVKSIQITIVTETETLKILEGQIKQLQETDYKTQINGFEKKRKEEIDRLTLEKESIEKQIKGLKDKEKKEIEKIEKKVKEWESKIGQFNQVLKKRPAFEKEQEKIENEYNTLNTNKFHLTQLVKNTETEISTFKRIGVGKCPTCRKPMTGEDLKKEIAKSTKELSENKKKVKGIVSKMQEVSTQLAITNKGIEDLDSFESQKTTLNQDISDAKIDVLRCQKSQESQILITTLEKAKVLLNEQKSGKNPYEKQEKERVEMLHALTKRFRDQKQAVDALNEEILYYQFWVEGYKKIRISLFKTMIDRFQDYAQELLSQYTSLLQVKFSTEKENRSGTIKDEFDIAITDQSGTTLSYEMYSGGEKQKVRLSITRALSQMIKDDCGIEFNFEIYDEPNDALDGVGKEINFDMFSKLAEEGKAVICTDHDASFKDRFDNTLLVIKKDNKSYISEREK